MYESVNIMKVKNKANMTNFDHSDKGIFEAAQLAAASPDTVAGPEIRGKVVFLPEIQGPWL